MGDPVPDERAARIVEAWLSQVSPLDKFAIVDGKLTFEDLSKGHRDGEPRQYTVRWATWDGNGHTAPLTNATGSEFLSSKQRYKISGGDGRVRRH